VASVSFRAVGSTDLALRSERRRVVGRAAAVALSRVALDVRALSAARVALGVGRGAATAAGADARPVDGAGAGVGGGAGGAEHAASAHTTVERRTNHGLGEITRLQEE
jgi:hypothetical protein